MYKRSATWILASFLFFVAADAHADQLTLTDNAHVHYFVDYNITFSTTSSASGAASEASYTQAVAASTIGGGMTMTTLNDMFDGGDAMLIAIDSAQQILPQTGHAGFEFYNRTGSTYTISCGGQEMLFPIVPSMLAPGLQMSRRVFVPTTDSFIRWSEVMTNTTASPMTIYVGVANNLGSDNNTRITMTSSGDLVATIDDTWVASFQNFSGTTSSDPRIGHVLRGTGSAAGVLSALHFVDTNDRPYWWYTVAIPAGETRIVMHFATPSGSRAGAAAQAEAIANLTSPATIECFTPAEVGDLVNFDVGCGTRPDGSHCDDGDRCTTSDACHAGVCGGSPVDCRAGGTTCSGVCNPTTGACDATIVPDGLSCDDGNHCSLGDVCTSGVCHGTGQVDCRGGITSCSGVCNPASGSCDPTPLANGVACDDRNACTFGDSCTAGVCGSTTPRSCSDGDLCTNDTCAPGSGCVFLLIPACRSCTFDSNCDDMNACNGRETCVAGTCAAAAPPVCDDGDACTTDTCVAGTGCRYAAMICDDHDPCTPDTCDSSGTCRFGPATCVDGGPGVDAATSIDAGAALADAGRDAAILTPDAGIDAANTTDASTGTDAAHGDGGAMTSDASSHTDAATTPTPPSSGCACRTSSGRSTPAGALALAGLMALAIGRRRRAREV